MKRPETERENGNSDDSGEKPLHSGAQFMAARDSRNRRVAGLSTRNGRFYAGRGYYYGGRFWARPYFGYGVGIPFGWGYYTDAGCGYYDGWGYWQPAPCYVDDSYYFGR